MTDGSALLRAIIANPLDDTPRLVYADWLDENGDPDRAEFIRGQVRLSAMEPWDEGYTELDLRCRQLERSHPEWFSVADDFVSRSDRFCGQRDRPVERGFLSRVELTPAEFARHQTLFDENPITDVQFKMEGNRAASAWLKRRALTRLTGVEFAYLKSHSRVKELLDCLALVQPLQHFGLLGFGREELDARAMCATPVVAGARSLCIAGTHLSDETEKTIFSAAWPNLRSLVRIWLTSLDWLRAPWINQLRELRVSDTEPYLNPDQRRLLADILPGTDIHALELGWWELDVPGGHALGAAVARSRVRSLALAQTHTRVEVARAIFTPESLAGLRALYLSWADLDAEVVGRLAGTGLRVCALDHATPDVLAALTKPPGLAELADLRLGLVWRRAADPFPDRLRALLVAGTLPRLASLRLYVTTPGHGSEVRHGDQIAAAVAGSPAASTLRELYLGESVTSTGAKAIAKSPHLDGLQLLTVRVWPKDTESERLLADRFGERVQLDTVGIEF